MQVDLCRRHVLTDPVEEKHVTIEDKDPFKVDFEFPCLRTTNFNSLTST